MLRELHQRNKTRVYCHIAKHHKLVHKHMMRIHRHVQHTSHIFLYFGEMIVICAMGFWNMMHAGSSNLPNNSSFSYPLKMVSTAECRTLYWEDMPDSCKISLPIIKGANYATYAGNSLYKSIYTTLWAAPYSDSWNQTKGAHAGVDIATARGTPVYSIGNGVVYSAGRNSSYGNVIKVKYIYKGEIIYAVYAHLDTIEVGEGATVTKGQKIGTSGNSGNTFGALGGYHLHFEIDKNNGGRPAYSYTNCADVSRGHYTIIQNGLCRDELFKYQYDPIKVLEGVSDLNGISNQTIPVKDFENSSQNMVANQTDNNTSNNTSNDTSNNTSNNTSNDTSNDISNTTSNTTSNDTSNTTSNTISSNTSNNTQNDNPNNTENNITNNNSNNTQNNSSNNNSNNENSHNAPQNVENKQDITPVNEVQKPTQQENKQDEKIDQKTENTQQEIQQEVQGQGQNNLDQKTESQQQAQPVNEVKPVESQNTEKDPTILDLNFDKLTGMPQHFMTQRDIEMKSELKKRSLKLGETVVIEIEVFKKGMSENRDGNYLNGVLQVPFEFVNNNNGISLNINTLQLLTKGKAKIQVTGISAGTSAILINLGGQKIGVLNIEVK